LIPNISIIDEWAQKNVVHDVASIPRGSFPCQLRYSQGGLIGALKIRFFVGIYRLHRMHDFHCSTRGLAFRADNTAFSMSAIVVRHEVAGRLSGKPPFLALKPQFDFQFNPWLWEQIHEPET
jgi:hypothetical protein